MLDYSWYLLTFCKSDIILAAEGDVVTDNPSSVARYWGKKAKKVGTVDCLGNLDKDVQEGVRACIRDSSTTLRPEWKVDHPQLHLTLMRRYKDSERVDCMPYDRRSTCRSICPPNSSPSTKVRQRKGSQCSKKGVPQGCVMRPLFDFEKKKTIRIGPFIRLSGSPHLEFLGTEVMQLRTVM